jgi:hypothetical protein
MHSSLPKPQLTFPNHVQRKFEQLHDPAHSLCREDLIWILEFVKKKVAEGDPHLMELPQPRLLQNFRYFAEIALMLIHQRARFDQEADRLISWIAEATYGLTPLNPHDKPQ